MIELSHVTKILRGKRVLDDISCTFEEGKVYGLMGINGAGKTMLMRTVCGLILPTSGSVIVDGKAIGGKESFPQSIGALIENPSFIGSYSGKENLCLLAQIQNNISATTISETLCKVGLDPNDRRKYRKYSLGMKQRLGIAAAIMESPRIVILDEPLNALDEDGVVRIHRIVEELKEKGTTVILSCHDKDVLFCMSDIVHKMENGRITKFNWEG